MLTKDHPRAKELFLLGKACLDYHSSGHASVATVQAILLQGTYILNDSRKQCTSNEARNLTL